MSATTPTPKHGVLLINLGSPSKPDIGSVRRFLREFLSDPRVVNLPRPLWWAILHGFVLPFRPRKSAHAYRSIWTAEGSPLIYLTQHLTSAVARRLEPVHIHVEMAMSYGDPSLAGKLREFKQLGINALTVLPLYPQYSSTTTASVFDAVTKELQSWRDIPSLNFINAYYQNPAYIEACAESIRSSWRTHGKGQKLIMSFHGLPAKLTELGDPYYRQCLDTAALIAQQLQLHDSEWVCVFQSRFGRAEWLKPYCIEVLQQLPQQGVTAIDIVCPGFAVDCLETLEEIALTNKEIFLQAGGHGYRYIPALNAGEKHVDALVDVLRAATAPVQS